MICPICKQETPSVLNYCKHCKGELQGFHDKRNENLLITGSRKFLFASLGSTILSGLAIAYVIINYMFGIIMFHPVWSIGLPIYFLISLTGFLGTLFSKKTWQKTKKIEYRQIDGSFKYPD